MIYYSCQLFKRYNQKIKNYFKWFTKKKRNVIFTYVSQKQLNLILFKELHQKIEVAIIQSISKIELDDVKSFIKENITLDLIIVAGGDFDIDEFESHTPNFRQLKKRTKLIEIKLYLTKVEEKTSIKRDKTSLYLFLSSFNIDLRKDEENYKAKVVHYTWWFRFWFKTYGRNQSKEDQHIVLI